MGAKRVLLIAGGTIGGLGAVLSITPPQFGSTTGGSLSGHTLGGGTTTSPATSTTSTPAPTQAPVVAGGGGDDGGGTIGAKPKPAPTATKKATKKGTTATPAPAATTAAPAAAKPSGTFVGATSQTRFGPVQVQITLSNGKITAAKALQFPNNDFRSQSISQQAIPYLVQETLAANSANIQGVGGASYTSQGWYDSLVSALAKAGM
jgi:uncharacterized protein with FMN-binding domain